jgi:hypothetical protein
MKMGTIAFQALRRRAKPEKAYNTGNTPKIRTLSTRAAVGWRPSPIMSFTNAMVLKMRKTPSKKITVDLRGNCFQKDCVGLIGSDARRRILP